MMGGPKVGKTKYMYISFQNVFENIHCLNFTGCCYFSRGIHYLGKLSKVLPLIIRNLAKNSTQPFYPHLCVTTRCDYSNESSQWVHSNGTVCVITKESSFSYKRILYLC